MSRTVVCTATPAQTEIIVAHLQSDGFLTSDISVLMSDTRETREFAVQHHTRAPQGAAAGVGTGIAVGGVIGWLAGVGTLVVPGLGALIAAGPILGAVSAAVVAGTAGGIVGALIGLGIPEPDARKIEGRVRGGRAMISVHSEDAEAVRRARDIFEDAGADDISVSGEPVPRRPR